MSNPLLLEHDLLSEVLETLAALVVVLDREGRIVLFNRSTREASGYATEDVEGERFWDVLIPADDRQRVQTDFARTLEGEELEDRELDWLGRGGERRTISWRTRPLRSAEGAVELVLATGVDVTDRRRAEGRVQALAEEESVRNARTQALSASERKLAGIVSLATDAIIFVDEAQNVTLFNEGAERTFGYPAGDVIGGPLEILIPAQYRQAHPEHIRRFGDSPVQARKMGERHRIAGLRKDGTEFPAEASIVKLEVDGERIYAVILRDVTDRARTQEAQRFLADAGEVLASSLDYEETLRSVAHLAVSALADLCIIDMVQEDGSVERLEVVHRDPAKRACAERLLPFPLHRDQPHLMWKVLTEGKAELQPDVTLAHLEEMAQGPEHVEVLQALELRSYMVVPLLVRHRLTGTILLGSTDEGRRYGEADLALATELARRAGLSVDNARLYRDAQKALRGRDHVLGVVSHDLGNPLAAVAMAAEALEGSVPVEDEKGRYYLDALSRSARLMERLIHDLLEVRRMEEGHLRLEMESLQVGPLVSAALELLEPLAAVKSIQLASRVPADGLPAVWADADRVVQVLSNLVGNAVKHAAGESGVTVEARCEDEEIVVSVTDTGPGIPAEELMLVFEPFWRARKSPGGGIGLGLSIAREIVRSHGGRIWVESQVGEGSTFHFTLPVSDVADDDGASGGESEGAGDG